MLRQRYLGPGLFCLAFFAPPAAAAGGKTAKPGAVAPSKARSPTPAVPAKGAKSSLAAPPRRGKPVPAPSPVAAKATKKPAAAPLAREPSAKTAKSAEAPAKGPKPALAPALAKTAKPAPPPKPHENAYLEIPERSFAESTLAFHYANLSDEEALAELGRRGIAWVSATPPLPGVRTPIRLTAPLHGVFIHSTLPPAERAASAFEILDARLALALDDFCALLGRHDVVELVHYTMYRPPGETPANWQHQIRHPAGLAIDVGAFKKRDGTWLAVGPHWPSNIGAKTCGDGAVEQWGREARELASIVCEAADERLFHFALTPDFDAAHADHVHLEIKPATRWFIVN